MQRTSAQFDSIYPDRHPTSLRAWVDVDLDAVRRNARHMQALAGVPLIPMVKADAYGVGMLPVVRALGARFRDEAPRPERPDTPWAFGVATLDEAATLRQAGCIDRVLCTTPLLLRELPDAKALDVRPALHRPEEIVAWSALGGGPWHLSVDTGMSRAGADWTNIESLDLLLRAHPPEGVFTHFHSAESENGSREQQEVRFAQACAALPDALRSDVLRHSDNSAALATRGRANGQLARPGVALYGAGLGRLAVLEQVVHLRARIVDIHELADGDSVSYEATWRAQGPRRIATVPVGYADGYRRALSNRGMVSVRGQLVPVAGIVTMDMTMIDVTALGSGCAVGDMVTLIGGPAQDGLNTDAVAAMASLSPYELLVGLRLRAQRRYFESESPVFPEDVA